MAIDDHRITEARCPECDQPVEITVIVERSDGTIKRVNGVCPEHGMVSECTITLAGS